MQLVCGEVAFSASDLINFLECAHLTHLDLARLAGRHAVEPTRTDAADLVARKGDEHERAYLEALEQTGHEVRRIDRDDPDPAGATRRAMSAGAEVIYQAALGNGRWRGSADFLRRVPVPSGLGEWSYEVADTKLARRVKPYFLVQLCLYSELLDQAQGLEPEWMHVVLGTRAEESFRLAEFSAYFRRLRSQFTAFRENGAHGTYPDPVPHCGLCRWSDHCDETRERDDHLSLVARMRSDQIVRLAERGISTVAQLAEAQDDGRPLRMGTGTFDRLRDQARLQVEQRRTGEPSYRLLEPEEHRGFELLPAPSDGDIFFDMEGDPFYEDGLEYLFGLTYLEDGEATYKSFWGRDRAEEKLAFQQFIDFVTERIERYPDLHVYHYAHYEPTALKRLMGLHATREDEVDNLLRGKRLVDLYRVVEQALRISQPSYSIKKVEASYMPEREASVTDAEDSILKFEEWLDTGDDALLGWIERYNEDDCHSTYLLRNWLLQRRDEAIAQYGVEIPWRSAEEPQQPQPPLHAEVAALRERLLAKVPDDPVERSAEQAARWLMAQLLDYHRREAQPAWWEYFDRHERDEQELLELDAEAISCLSPAQVPVRTLPPPARSVIHTLEFPPQEHKIGPGAYEDPFTGASFNVEAVDDPTGQLEIRRGADRKHEPLPRALIPGGPIPDKEQRTALLELGTAIAGLGLDGDGPFRAARDLLARALPRTGAVERGASLQAGGTDIEQLKRIAAGLERSYLFVQGPPGSGKTWTGAQLAADLLAHGHRVGVASTSHKAINKLLEELEATASPPLLCGLKKSTDADGFFESRFEPPAIANSRDNADFPPPAPCNLIAGTAWLWARSAMRESVDFLIVDEAGQVSLADALSMCTAARNVILLGDPLQLAHVSQGTHPEGSGDSVLQHLLGEASTVREDRGAFLEKTRRMHPLVCEFVSSAVYNGRLTSIEGCERQEVRSPGLNGAGVRSLLVPHEGNARQSPEEAAVIAEQVELLLAGGAYGNASDDARPLRPTDIMVVTPYNAQVRCLRAHLPAAVRVGTVDKFQGQEAPVVFFSMATSSGANVPGNVEFLYSRNRLNVAVSRAQCLAVLVASPKLLHIRCRSAEQMRLVNALCLLVEIADSQHLSARTDRTGAA